jgi:hypothetical protein
MRSAPAKVDTPEASLKVAPVAAQFILHAFLTVSNFK